MYKLFKTLARVSENEMAEISCLRTRWTGGGIIGINCETFAHIQSVDTREVGIACVLCVVVDTGQFQEILAVFRYIEQKKFHITQCGVLPEFD
jgi:hypothetical protein